MVGCVNVIASKVFTPIGMADRVKKMNKTSLIVSYEALPRSNFDRRVERSEELVVLLCCFLTK